MKQPKEPSSQSLTKKGQPRKRAEGAGRPDAGRKVRLSLVSAECLAQFHAIAAAIAAPGKKPCVADAIEQAAAEMFKRLKL